MLMSEGPTAAFTRSIPIIIMLTLAVSYLFAVFVTPVLSRMNLVASDSENKRWMEKLGRRLATVSLRRPRTVVTGAVLLVVLSVILAGNVEQQFFPSSDRSQMVIDLKLDEGSHLDATDWVARVVEEALLERPDVMRVAAFMGRSAPQFYYNLNRMPFSPHYAQIIVETRRPSDIDPIAVFVGNLAREKLAGIELISRKLEQGPPVQASVEVRLFGDDFGDLHRAAVTIAGELESIPGTRDIRHDLGPGAPSIRFRVDDVAAARYGLTRSSVARTLYGRTRGQPVGELYTGEDPIPVVVRSSAREHLTAESLETLDLQSSRREPIPLSQVARLESAWSPAAIRHRDGRRVVTVSSQLAKGVTSVRC